MTYLEKQELLDEVKRRYPFGCKVSNYNLGKGCNFTITNFIFRYENNGDVLVNCSQHGWYTIYSEGQWAEIISYPEGYIPTILNEIELIL